MRSVEVVFPASMWAMMPMLRVSSSLTGLAISVFPSPRVPLLSLRRATAPFRSPPVMGKGLIGLGHAVHVLFLLHSAAAAIGCINQLLSQLIYHRLAGTASGIQDQPADSQRLPPEGVDLHWHLVIGAAHAARLDFEHRLNILDCLLEDFQRVVIGLLGDLVHRLIENALRS